MPPAAYAPINQPVVDPKTGYVTTAWREFFQQFNTGTGTAAGITQLTGDVTTGIGGGVQAATIAPLAVTTGKIANLAVTTAKIADAAVTYAKIQDVSAASRLLGRGSAGGAGDVEEISLDASLTMSGTTLSVTNSTDIKIHWSFTTVGNAALLTLPSAYVSLVSAPGSTKFLVPLWATIYLDSSAGAYTNITAGPEAGWTIAYGDWEEDAYTFMPFTGASTRYVLMPMHDVPDATVLLNNYPDITDVFGSENKALKLVAWNDAGNYTGGNAANVAKVGVAYAILNYVTGVFS